MKKVYGLGLLFSSVFLLAACGGGDEEKESATSSSSSTTQVSKNSEVQESSTKPAGDFVATASDSFFDGTMLRGNSYSVRITDHRVIQPGEAGNEYGDSPVLAFWFDTLVNPDYDNSNPVTPNNAWIFNFEAVQDNDPNMVNKLNVASLPDNQFLDSQMAEIKPGGTVASAVAYTLTDTETPVTLTAKDMLGTEYGKAEFPVK
ncbi:DUF5067 domain-containing protein [Candidatus Enterococcus clewellii]|uniref:DUF5067 domain-containing protein n=1 Tax=Candidatus Enterococcus clewellii TaxID=1834193 RepID=A0A242K7V6_9ENTE|nr:DUF5067 domain-containing protein [Enterococcus sp. 9E7_DIV0242]OTP17251.1 hypothetical protein A5888_001389 [Enterococcus sp. 9E7_DIV0242]